MKKPQRNFIVEYKSGRRKVDSQVPTSIWGNLDLKSVARDVETDLPVRGEHLKQPKKPAPENRAPAQLAPTWTDTVIVESPRLASSVFGDRNAEPNGHDKQDVGVKAVHQGKGRKPGKANRTRRTPARQPHRPERRQAPAEHNDEPDNLELLEKENRLLKIMLAEKLRKENSWLRERLQQR